MASVGPKIALDYLPEPDFLEFSLPDTHVALVTNEGSALTSAVIKALEAKGNQVILLDLPSVSNQSTHDHAIRLASDGDADIAQAVAKIKAQYGPVGTFIHLHPHLEFQGANFAQHFQTDRSIVKTVFLLAKHLQADLNELGQRQRANFLTVTRLDGKLGLGGRGNVSVVGGGLNGLTKSLNLEWTPVYCRAVDIQPELPVPKVAAQVIAELHDADATTVETGYSESGRCTIATTPVATGENTAITTTVTPDSVFPGERGSPGHYRHLYDRNGQGLRL